jgi:hypothetical protein
MAFNLLNPKYCLMPRFSEGTRDSVRSSASCAHSAATDVVDGNNDDIYMDTARKLGFHQDHRKNRPTTFGNDTSDFGPTECRPSFPISNVSLAVDSSGHDVSSVDSIITMCETMGEVDEGSSAGLPVRKQVFKQPEIVEVLQHVSTAATDPWTGGKGESAMPTESGTDVCQPAVDKSEAKGKMAVAINVDLEDGSPRFGQSSLALKGRVRCANTVAVLVSKLWIRIGIDCSRLEPGH